MNDMLSVGQYCWYVCGIKSCCYIIDVYVHNTTYSMDLSSGLSDCPCTAYKHPSTVTPGTYIGYKICHLCLCIHVVIFGA